MIRKLLPDPLLTLGLIALWLVLNRSYGLGHWLFAVVLGVLVPVLVQPLRPVPVFFKRPGSMGDPEQAGGFAERVGDADFFERLRLR